MDKKIILVFIGFMFLYNSCCPFIKEENLGNNFYLSEYDNVDRRILYSEKACSNSGIEMVPMTVTEYAYDLKWIVAKSSLSRQGKDFQYWIIDKSFKVKIIQDNDSTINMIKSHVLGPLDSTKFVQLLFAKESKLINQTYSQQGVLCYWGLTNKHQLKQSQSSASAGQTPLSICTNNELLIINLTAVMGGRMIISQQHKALNVGCH
jgi:hypothetical protein